MSQPFVCARCRLNLALRAPAPRVPGKRQYSRSAPIAQEHRQDRRSQPFHANENSPQPSNNVFNGFKGTSSGHQRANGPRGRYSGALQPHQLLEQLDDRRPSKPRRQTPGKDRSKPSQNANTWQRSTLELRRDLEPLLSSINENRLHDAWGILQGYCNEPEGLGLKGGKVPKALAVKIGQLMRRLDVAWVKSLQGGSIKDTTKDATEERLSPANELESLYLGRETKVEAPPKPVVSLPTPFEFTRVTSKLGLLTPALRVETLWRLGKGVMAADINQKYALQPGKMDEMLDQLVLLWHDAFFCHLKESGSSSAESKVESLDWSFLPPVDLVAEVRKGTVLSLQDVLAMLVPSFASGEPNSSALADYQSALIISLDVLQSNGIRASIPTEAPRNAGPREEKWKPLTTYLEKILKHSSKSVVPPAIQAKLEFGEDPTLAYYEGLVRRFDLQDIPPIRTVRGRVVDQNHRPSTALDELARPIKRTIPKAIDETAPTAAAESEELEQNAAAEEPTAALSRERLREAGFTVTDVFDMDPDVHRKVNSWIKRLGRATENTNLDIAQHCWAEVGEFNTAESGSASLPLYLYEHFMMAFLAVRQPKLAIEVWNQVIQAGLEPTVRTWTVMMRGCARAKDADTMEAFWRRMRDQEVKPDTHAWSVRITCLINSGRIQEGLNAVNQMGQEWVAAVKRKHAASTPKTHGKKHTAETTPNIDYSEYTTDIDSIPRPTVEIMNTAISALANKSDADIPTILAWGRAFNLSPNLITYNALLNVSMRHNQTPEALSLLARMRASNIAPDSTTFTVLLTALFQSPHLASLPPTSQTTTLLSLITSIEATSPSARLDTKAYALAIDRMLKVHANPAAARALLEHMSSRGIEPTPHIYTILMTSYFASNPPDFAAAEALWTRIQHSDSGYGAVLDTIFYDRMVESYARHHRDVGLEPCLRFLSRMSREGKRPGWRALELVARAMVERGEWGRLQGLVGDLREEEGLLRVGVRGRMGQDEFWRFVLGTGVLGEEGGEGLRRRVGGSSFHGVRGG